MRKNRNKLVKEGSENMRVMADSEKGGSIDQGEQSALLGLKI